MRNAWRHFFLDNVFSMVLLLVRPVTTPHSINAWQIHIIATTETED